MDFNAMFQTWIKVLTKPGEPTFEEERHSPNANLRTAIIWVVVAAAIAAVFSAIGAVIGGLLGFGSSSFMETIANQADLPPDVAAQMAAMSAGSVEGGAVSAFCLTLIVTPIGFLIGSGIYFLVAKLFGGTGSFEEQTYLLAAVAAPLTIVSGVIGIVPILGGCISIIVSIYQLVLSYFAIKVSHNLTSGQAIGVIIIPVVVILACVICGVVAISVLFASAMSGS